MKINIKRLTENAVLPTYAKLGDGAMDLTAVSKEIINEDGYGYIEYKTGIAIELPEGYVGLLFPRSSVSKTGLILANSVPVIDSGYRGDIALRFKWIPDTVSYEVGDRIAQLMIIPIPQIEFIEVDELSETERQESGFGSSGK